MRPRPRARLDRLDEVVVDADLEPARLAVDTPLGSQHQDRHAAGQRVVAQRLRECQTVHPRHVQVADDDVRDGAPGELQAGQAVLGHQDLEPFQLEEVFHYSHHGRAVFDDQDPGPATVPA